jgi:hypothetical protein
MKHLFCYQAQCWIEKSLPCRTGQGFFQNDIISTRLKHYKKVDFLLDIVSPLGLFLELTPLFPELAIQSER